MAEYGQHTSCVSEAEKYEKTLYKAKTNVKMNPQEAWMELIAEAATRKQEAPANISEHLGRLSELDNVPRNCNKFTNFAKNSLRLNNNSIVDGIWKFLEQLKNEKVQLAVTTVSNDEKKAEKDVSGKQDPSEHQEKKGEKRKVEETQSKEIVPADSTEDDVADRKKRKQEKKQKKLDRLAAEETATAAVVENEHASSDVVENREKKSKKQKREKIVKEVEEVETVAEEKEKVNDKMKKKKDKKEKEQKV